MFRIAYWHNDTWEAGQRYLGEQPYAVLRISPGEPEKVDPKDLYPVPELADRTAIPVEAVPAANLTNADLRAGLKRLQEALVDSLAENDF
eukprot:TRINITY_DN2842_c0_g1_i1.p1 TRINITY_DN2842_c0_g1~~TRINITY_DN2842_c0_g1_i1.p1  ORF type:complete len:90 (+),score=13.07 TRINITY_DN2842_c0_g1_i1:239-508(+)